MRVLTQCLCRMCRWSPVHGAFGVGYPFVPNSDWHLGADCFLTMLAPERQRLGGGPLSPPDFNVGVLTRETTMGGATSQAQHSRMTGALGPSASKIQGGTRLHDTRCYSAQSSTQRHYQGSPCTLLPYRLRPRQYSGGKPRGANLTHLHYYSQIDIPFFQQGRF